MSSSEMSGFQNQSLDGVSTDMRKIYSSQKRITHSSYSSILNHARPWALEVMTFQPGPHTAGYLHSYFKHNIKSQPSHLILQLFSAQRDDIFCLTVQMWQCTRQLCFGNLNWLTLNLPGTPRSLLNQVTDS